MHEHARRFEDTPMGKVVKMWPLMVAMVTLVFAVGTTTSTISHLEDNLKLNDKRDVDQEQRLVSVEEGKRNIEKRLDRIEDKLDAILRAVK